MNKPDKKTMVLFWCLLGFLGLTGLSLFFYIQFHSTLALKTYRLKEDYKFKNNQLIKQTREEQQNRLPGVKPVSVSELYQSIEANAKGCQMIIYHFAVSQPKPETKEVIVDLALDGDYREFTRFLINLQRETSLFNLLSCRMTPSKVKSSTVDITLKLRFKIDGGIQ